MPRLSRWTAIASSIACLSARTRSSSKTPIIPTARRSITRRWRRIAAYAQSQGWTIAEVLHEEQGVLPVVSAGDWDGFWRSSGGQIARAGTRAGLFHPVTSYSVPEAVRFALAVAQQADLSHAALAGFSERWAKRHWQRTGFARLLSAMLFQAAEPLARYRMMEHFYRLDTRLVERFYAGRSIAGPRPDFRGSPPVPVSRALAVLAGSGARPRPLTLAGMRKQ
jgi:lycopene beta-cyclase